MKHKLNDQQIRQGDVLCDRIDAIPKSMRPMQPDTDGSVTLAHGEITGHRHRFRAGPDGASDSMLYAHPVVATEPARLEVPQLDELVHEEHSPHAFLPGQYRISRPYEYTGAELRRVED